MTDENENVANSTINLYTAYHDALLRNLVFYVQEQYHLLDPAPFVLSLATVVANRMNGSPVWLMLVGPPSSGKTALISSTIDLPGVFETATLTEASLLSGTAKREQAEDATGGLLRQIGDRGLLVMKDFTSILGMNRDTRGTVLAALREIFDGRWTRSVGTDGAKQLKWVGKMGLLAGVTDAIDTHHAVIASMGDRFLYYRMPDSDGGRIAQSVLDRDGGEDEIQKALRRQVNYFIGTIRMPLHPQIEENDKHWIKSLAMLTADSRGAVERDSYRRDITDVLRPELPGRLAGCFGQLFSALEAIGCSAVECKRLLRLVASHCLPRQRQRLISALASKASAVSAESLAVDGRLRHPETSVRRVLEDMECFHMVERVQLGLSHVWKLTPEYAKRWKQAWATEGPFPKCQ